VSRIRPAGSPSETGQENLRCYVGLLQSLEDQVEEASQAANKVKKPWSLHKMRDFQFKGWIESIVRAWSGALVSRQEGNPEKVGTGRDRWDNTEEQQ